MTQNDPELSSKHQALIALMELHQVDAILLETQPSIAWYLSGARVHVSLAAPPVVRVLVHRGGTEVATPLAEADRLQAEELPAAPGLGLHPLDWFADPGQVGTWFPDAAGWLIASEQQLEAPLRALRQILSVTEIARYRQLCRDAAELMTDTLSGATAQLTELELAARLAAGAVRLGAEPTVVLVAGAGRYAYRHPLPTGAVLGRRAMAVLCLRRHGLIANITRWVHFGPRTAAEAGHDRAILEVEAEIFAALQPGRGLGELLPVIQQSYPRHGFDAREWSRHHQGGIAGYNGRDPRLAPGAQDPIRARQAFAWNPSAAAAPGQTVKVEDTVLLTEEGRIEVLTNDPRWPSVAVGTLQRPVPLEL
ncbi:M24 family metallopeptidase [Glutamicibacter sp. MNS18]|uniref:M24 family metallopeptidase n=1 Tax=Glutamicibacter sp. MNS18 TaxID=2989817 RepID=UPI00223574BE|nr:M24 family metallopeptidase [Glutamicibacter sp. MNS18]MCW4466680.1 M24 family metallopeptidase [Glutamicibacter sp. MNS18]